MATRAGYIPALLIFVLAGRADAKPELKLTVDGKPIHVDKISLVKDGQLCLNIDGAKGGVGICFSGDAKAGAPVDGKSITVHRSTGKDTENLMGKGTYHVELTTLKLGSWKAPGKCAGTVTLAIDDPKGSGAVATVEGSFAGVECYAM